MNKFTDINQFLKLLQGVKASGDGMWIARCPAHKDKNPSLGIKLTKKTIGVHCFAGCPTEEVVKALGITMAHLFLSDGTEPKPPKAKVDRSAKKPDVMVTYPYVNAEGKLLFEVCRTDPKGFYQRRPDPTKPREYINNLEGINPVLYRLDKVMAAIDRKEHIVIPEGEKDVHNLEGIGVVATCNPMGAGKWRDTYSESLRNADIIIIPDKDKAGYQHAYQVAASCYGRAVRVRILELPGEYKDVSDWLQAEHIRAEFENLVVYAKDYKPTQHENILERCSHWLYMLDPGPIEVTLGAIAANKLPGDPVWLLQIGTPGSGKTEILNTIASVKDVHQVAILTEASLLSGTPRRDAPNAKGGLLREIGEFGILQVKDFGSVLSLNRDSRGPILAALREIYDGSWTRYVGTEGGKTLSWKGKCGLVGGVTPSIDGFYVVMAILGERFVYYRLPEGADDDNQRAQKALEHAGHEVEMRTELSNLVADFFNTLNISKPPPLTPKENTKLIQLARFATRCRSPIERDTFANREIQLIPGVESPTRMVKVLSQLLHGLEAIGIPTPRVWKLVEKVALDSMPLLRQKVVLAMLGDTSGNATTAPGLALKLGYPTNTVSRVLEDMTCYGLIARDKQGQGNPDLWTLTDWTRKTYEIATAQIVQDAHQSVTKTKGVPEIREKGKVKNNNSLNKLNNKNNKKRIQGRVTGDKRKAAKSQVENTPPYPTAPCRCGRKDFWLRPSLPGKHDAEWICKYCHPKPPKRRTNDQTG